MPLEELQSHWREKAKNRIRSKRLLVNEFKTGACVDCGLSYPFYAMDFDHRPEEVKLFSIKNGVSSHSMEAIEQEIAKCDLVCANCHRGRTYSRQLLALAEKAQT